MHHWCVEYLGVYKTMKSSSSTVMSPRCLGTLQGDPGKVPKETSDALQSMCSAGQLTATQLCSEHCC